MNVIKKALSILLLAVFLFDLLGYIPLFKIAQHKIQKEIKGRLKKTVPEDELYVISVPVEKTKNLEWKKEGKEFMHHGTMYDVVKSETKDGVVHYHCINDSQETKLFVHLEELVNDQMNKDVSPIGKTAKNIAKLFSSFKYVASGNSTLMTICSNYSSYFKYSISFAPVYREIFSPPPNPAG